MDSATDEPFTTRIAAPLEAATRLGMLAEEDLRTARIRATAYGRRRHRPELALVGIVGPNNAGKSALFSALSRTTHSPSSARGGFTVDLRGAAASSCIDEARRTLEHLLGGGGDVDWTVAQHLPPDAALVDSPDFDSTTTTNHAVAEQLILTADLLVVVVTKNSYNNEVVHAWLAEARTLGRPYAIVLNEGTEETTARSQVDEMVATATFSPCSTWWSVHDLAVARGERPLEPIRLDGPSARMADLSVLLETSNRDTLIDEARAADLRGLRDTIEGTLERIATVVGRSQSLLAQLNSAADRFADSIARAGMPLQPLLGAFRTQLDEASKSHASWRRTVEWLPRTTNGMLRFAGRQIASSFGFGTTDDPNSERDGESSGLTGPERTACAAALPQLVATLEASLVDDERTGSERASAIRNALDAIERPLASHEEACNRIVHAALARRGGSRDLQWLASALSTVPVAGSGALVIATGGIGLTDLAGAAAVAVGQPFVDRILDVLGTQILDETRAAWVAERATQIRQAVVTVAAPTQVDRARDVLEAQATHWTPLRRALDEILEELRTIRPSPRTTAHRTTTDPKQDAPTRS